METKKTLKLAHPFFLDEHGQVYFWVPRQQGYGFCGRLNGLTPDEFIRAFRIACRSDNPPTVGGGDDLNSSEDQLNERYVYDR